MVSAKVASCSLMAEMGGVSDLIAVRNCYLLQLNRYQRDLYLLKLSRQMTNVCLLIFIFLTFFDCSCMLGTQNCFANKLTMLLPTFPILCIPLVGQVRTEHTLMYKRGHDIIFYVWISLPCGKFIQDTYQKF